MIAIAQSAAPPDPGVTTALASLHVEAFPGFFLTSMGRPFLRLLYAGFIAHPDGICLVAQESGKVVGLAAGASAPDGFFRSLLCRRGARLALAALPGLLRNPCFATRKCLGALCYRGETPAGIPDAALLSSLAVLPAAQSKGLGQALVRAFADEARRRGGKAIYLATDQGDNTRANRFYARCGFEILDTFRRPGNRVMNRWIMRLT